MTDRTEHKRHAGLSRIARRIAAHRGAGAIAILLAFAATAAATPAQASSRVTAASIGVTVKTTPCPGYEESAAGCYDPATRTIYWIDGDRRSFQHELAHAWEHDHLTDSDREWLTRKFPRLLGRGPWFKPPAPCWYDETQLCGQPSPGELFAEAWAWCRYPLKPNRVEESVYGFDNSRRHPRLCTAIAFLRILR